MAENIWQKKSEKFEEYIEKRQKKS